MKCTFVAGQRVVCVADNWINVATRQAVSGPAKDAVLKILEIDATLLHIVEYVGLSLEGWEGEWFDHECFRPLQDRPTETSIEELRQIAADAARERRLTVECPEEKVKVDEQV